MQVTMGLQEVLLDKREGALVKFYTFNNNI